MKNKMTTKEMMYVVAFSSLAIVVGIFEIPIGYIGVKLDFSEVIILLSFLILGFKKTTLVIILRSVIRFILPPLSASQTSVDPIWKLLGEFIAVIASLLLVWSLIIVKKITKEKQPPLLYAVPTTENNVKLKTFILLPTISAILLTLGMTIFHTVITMPMSISGYTHLNIFSFLKDPQYSSQHSLKTIMVSIIVGFGLVNVIKGVISPLVYLIIKPRIEKIVS